MITKILIPRTNAWADALKNLHKEGTITDDQLKVSLQRLEQTGSITENTESYFQESFLCPICREYHPITERGDIKTKFCLNCENEMFGEIGWV